MRNHFPDTPRSQQSRVERSLRRWRRCLIVLLLLSLIALAYCVFSLIPSAYDRGLSESTNAAYWSGFNYGKSLGADSASVTNSDVSAEMRDFLARHSTGSQEDAPSAPAPEEEPSPAVPIPYGHAADEIVYVSDRSGTIHSDSDCSGMKYYTRMTLEDALESGFTHYCEHCF